MTRVPGNHPYVSPQSAEPERKKPPVGSSGRVLRLMGIILLALSIFPLAATLFLVNQEFEEVVVPVWSFDGAHVGNHQISPQTVLWSAALMTGLLWVAGFRLIFFRPHTSGHQRSQGPTNAG